DIVRTRPGAGRRLGRDEDTVASPGDRLAEQLFRQAPGIVIGRIKERHARLERDIDKPRCLLRPGAGPGPGRVAAAAERGGAEREAGDLETGPAEQAIFHAAFPPDRGRDYRTATIETKSRRRELDAGTTSEFRWRTRCPGSFGVSGCGSDASACAAPSPRSGECARE